MQNVATQQNPQSGSEVAQNSHLLTHEAKASQKAGGSKFTPSWWYDRVSRRSYVYNGERREVLEWCARIKHDGRRETVGLATNNREEASRKAARLYQAIRSNGWTAALAEFRPEEAITPKGVVTLGDYADLVRPILKVRDRTFEGYAYAFRKIALEATGAKDRTKGRFDPKTLAWRQRANKIALSRLTPQLIETWKGRFILAAGKDPVAAQRARRNVNSFIRNARALFGRRILKRLAELSIPLPSPLPFAGVEMEKAGSTRYTSTVDAATLFAAARDELAKDDSEAWKVILLALGAGLRRSEIDGLCWTQIDFAKNEIRVVTHSGFEVKTDSSEGAIFVDPTLMRELGKLRRGSPGPFVVESTTESKAHRGQYYRCDATFARVTDWLRANGVMGDKPLHQLRKEFGSILCANADIHTASRQLRHANISTTAAYYADHRRKVFVTIPLEEKRRKAK